MEKEYSLHFVKKFNEICSANDKNILNYNTIGVISAVITDDIIGFIKFYDTNYIQNTDYEFLYKMFTRDEEHRGWFFNIDYNFAKKTSNVDDFVWWCGSDKIVRCLEMIKNTPKGVKFV